VNSDENISLYKHLELHDIEKDHQYDFLVYSLEDQEYQIVMQENHFQKQMYVRRMDYVDYFFLE
jgi:hypothetical protein